MFDFNINLGSICRSALENHLIYRRVERNFGYILAKRNHCCRNCRYFDNNPYLPCAVDPILAAMPERDNDCRFFECSRSN
jgi:hypothetical protein